MNELEKTWADSVTYIQSLDWGSDVVTLIVALFISLGVISGLVMWHRRDQKPPVAAGEMKMTKKQRRRLEVRKAIGDILSDALDEELEAKHPRLTRDEANEAKRHLAHALALWDNTPKRVVKVPNPQETKNRIVSRVGEKAEKVLEKHQSQKKSRLFAAFGARTTEQSA